MRIARGDKRRRVLQASESAKFFGLLGIWLESDKLAGLLQVVVLIYAPLNPFLTDFDNK